MPTLEVLPLTWLLLIVVYDFRERRVPNWLVLAGAVMALAVLAFGSGPLGSNWASALLGAAAGFGVLLVFYVVGLMGAGDVKFAGALGLWVGLSALTPIWIIGSVLAAVHGLFCLVLQQWPMSPRLALLLFGQPISKDGKTSGRRTRFIPYAAYLAIATAVWMVWGRQSQ
ncbi:prepilin peptidase CpaA [Variovorax boronicumulans]|uniref:Prepilin peptidase CpaA n=1 Tax=Variovorax boronicumulans TaxID=436515 RepID=A0AAW8E861_9BURK|nr:A24 family peptidase [Variovorax boronicumulans]MDP9882428.1 prepilin peptidase CpaA [Variovorax boronicumulans]MDP9927724.1 prepilin peptidase CpaA [Variovorax boronicumulans]